jgi:hypothetical protein
MTVEIDHRAADAAIGAMPMRVLAMRVRPLGHADITVSADVHVHAAELQRNEAHASQP